MTKITTFRNGTEMSPLEIAVANTTTEVSAVDVIADLMTLNSAVQECLEYKLYQVRRFHITKKELEKLNEQLYYIRNYEDDLKKIADFLDEQRISTLAFAVNQYWGSGNLANDCYDKAKEVVTDIYDRI